MLQLRSVAFSVPETFDEPERRSFRFPVDLICQVTSKRPVDFGRSPQLVAGVETLEKSAAPLRPSGRGSASGRARRRPAAIFRWRSGRARTSVPRRPRARQVPDALPRAR